MQSAIIAAGQREDSYPYSSIEPSKRTLLLLVDKTVDKSKYTYGRKPKPDADSRGIRVFGSDCSGYVRWLLSRSTNQGLILPEGSVVQHEFIREMGFKKSTTSAAMLDDGILRIAFLEPSDSRNGIGHVTLIHKGKTIESHRGAGPSRRVWNRTSYQPLCIVYVLALSYKAEPRIEDSSKGMDLPVPVNPDTDDGGEGE